MKYKIKQGMIFGILFLILAGAMLILAEAFKNAITAERMAAARTVEAGFNRGLDETFGNLNHAVKLSYAIDFEDTGSLTLFHKKVQELMEENEHISYVAYFKEDTLDYIYPADKFRSLIGKNMADFTYSITLAKVVKTPVVEGPANLLDENGDVFLFMQPLYNGTYFIGEIVVAMDSGYVLSSLGLNELENGNYDYELWRVDFLGHSKTVIATSDTTVDYSDAVKHEFSLPATWNISILPKGGWITPSEHVFINTVFLSLGLVLLGILILLYRILRMQKKLQIAKYTNADSGLFTMEGFLLFTNNRLTKNPDSHLCILELQLGNFRRFTKNMDREELVTYLMQLRQNITDCFPDDTVAARINDDSFILAIFMEGQQLERSIEDFILQLYWKRKIDDQKIFITPRCRTVTYPKDGRDALTLVKAVIKQFETKPEKDTRI